MIILIILLSMQLLMKKIKYNKYYNNEQSLSLTFKNHLNDVFKIIKSKIKKKDKIIEIGCGRGFFLKFYKKIIKI